MNNSPVFSTLHDAVLNQMVLDWGSDKLEIRLFTSLNSSATIIAFNVRAFSISHLGPWGRSSSINSVVIGVSIHENAERLTIEMQSGDLILIDAHKFELY